MPNSVTSKEDHSDQNRGRFRCRKADCGRHRRGPFPDWRLGRSLVPALMLLVAAGCAKIGDPLPPLRVIPPGVRDLNLTQMPGEVRLQFGLDAAQVRSLEIFRKCGSAGRGFEARDLLQRIEVKQLGRTPTPGQFRFSDRLPASSQVCSYAVRTIGLRGERSALSGRVDTTLSRVALPPDQLHATVQEDRILVQWSPPRRNADGSQPAHVRGFLVNGVDFVPTSEYEDHDFVFGKPRSYRVQTVSRRANPLLLSGFSDTLTVVPRDVFPPPSPQHVRALILEGKVQVLWDSVQKGDLAGYFVYRGNDPAHLKKISSRLDNNRYTDAEAVAGITYYYAVSSVDQTGNESQPSEVTSVVVP